MATSQPGTVYLIGAGPGDPGLITVNGWQLLQSCDVVLYDNLVPDELVITLPLHVEKHYVGKRAGKPCYSQGEINSLMLKLAKTGKSVARLKGSDPLIFGRGSEEARFLKQNGIRFEIIPGVTSGIAAAAYAGIPCTDRDQSSFVLFVTGHKAREKQVSSVPWDWVAQAGGGTIVVYMGVTEIAGIVSKLIGAGLSGATPAAVVERGTLATQRVFTCTIEGLPETVTSNNVRPPAIFILGNVVNLRSHLEWFDRRPLMGVRVMVTRPADQAQEMYRQLRELGADVLPYPTIATEEVVDEKSRQAVDNISSDDPWLVFTSENGVRYFLKQHLGRFKDVRTLAHYKIAVVGQGTASALAKHHLKPDFVPSQATTAALAQELAESRTWDGNVVVRVRGTLSV
ncbi:MAG: uroporphyrinogen-III C-methyltransferase, partial [Candidatus Zixiibacteriota bacterium]